MPADWKAHLAPAALVFAWVLFLYGKTAWSMVVTWERSETFAHGFVVLPIVAWLVWRKRASLAAEIPGASRPAVWILFPVGLAWLLGELAAANALSQLALVGLLAASVPALLGWRVARKLAFPLGFLFFAVPLGEFLIPTLMDWTAKFTILGLRLSGVPVYQDGRDFVIPSGNWSVVEACSGIRYLISSLMAGTLFAYLNFRSMKRRVAFVAVAGLVPLVANWVRAYGVVMIGHLSGNRLATGVDHLVYGWLFFGVVITLLFLIGYRWAEAEPVADRPAALEAGREPDEEAGREAAFDAASWRTAAVAALAAALPVLAMAGVEGLNAARPPVLAKDPEAFAAAGWHAVEGGSPAWRPVFRDAADSWHQAFEKDGRRVSLHIGYYRNQDHERKLAGSVGLPGSDDGRWTPSALGARELDIAGRRLAASGMALQPRPGQGAAPLLAWQWYWAGGAMTADPLEARARIAWSRLLGRGDDGAVIVLASPADEAGGEAALEAFSRSAGGAINHLLNQTRNRR